MVGPLHHLQAAVRDRRDQGRTDVHDGGIGQAPPTDRAGRAHIRKIPELRRKGLRRLPVQQVGRRPRRTEGPHLPGQRREGARAAPVVDDQRRGLGIARRDRAGEPRQHLGGLGPPGEIRLRLAPIDRVALETHEAEQRQLPGQCRRQRDLPAKGMPDKVKGRADPVRHLAQPIQHFRHRPAVWPAPLWRRTIAGQADRDPPPPLQPLHHPGPGARRTVRAGQEQDRRPRARYLDLE